MGILKFILEEIKRGKERRKQLKDIQLGIYDPKPLTNYEKRYAGYLRLGYNSSGADTAVSIHEGFLRFYRLKAGLANTDHNHYVVSLILDQSDEIAHKRRFLGDSDSQRYASYERVALEYLLSENYADARHALEIPDYKNLSDFEDKEGFFMGPDSEYYSNIIAKIFRSFNYFKLKHKESRFPDYIKFLIRRAVNQAREEDKKKSVINPSRLIDQLKYRDNDHLYFK
jgi:hypothetical protein